MIPPQWPKRLATGVEALSDGGAAAGVARQQQLISPHDSADPLVVKDALLDAYRLYL